MCGCEEKGSVWGEKKKERKKEGLLWGLVGLRLGLGDSTDNTVQESKVLLRDNKRRNRHQSIHVSDQKIHKHLHTQSVISVR